MTSPVYLSKVSLRAETPWFRRDFANCRAMHRLVMGAFPPVPGDRPARSRGDILFRVEWQRGGAAVYVQSSIPPDWGMVAARFPGYFRRPALVKDIAPLADRVRDGQRLRFRLLANAALPPTGGHAPVLALELAAMAAWLRGQGACHGFEVVRCAATRDVAWWPSAPPGEVNGVPTGRVTLHTVLYDGTLRITSTPKFADAIRHGIGQGRAFGLGLLSVAPAGGG